MIGVLTTMINLDTHVVIFALEDNLNLAEREAMQTEDWAISPIVLWEIAKLVERRRLNLNLDGHRFNQFLNSVDVIPIDINIARTCARLDFRSDPADQLIAATSIVYNIPLVTRDRTIRSSKIVPLAT